MAVFYEMDPASQSHLETASGEMALETGFVTSSQDPTVPSCYSVMSGRRSLFWFMFCFLKALKRCVTCCRAIKAFLRLFDFGSWFTVSCSWKMPSKDAGM